MFDKSLWLSVCIFIPASMFVLTLIEGIADVYAIRNNVGEVKFMSWELSEETQITSKPNYFHSILPALPWCIPFLVLLVIILSNIGGITVRYIVFLVMSLFALGLSSLIYQCFNQIPLAFTFMYLVILAFAEPLWEFTVDVINEGGFSTFLTILVPSWVILIVGMIAYLAAIERFRQYGSRLQPYALLIILGNIVGIIMTIQWIIIPYLKIAKTT